MPYLLLGAGAVFVGSGVFFGYQSTKALSKMVLVTLGVYFLWRFVFVRGR